MAYNEYEFEEYLDNNYHNLGNDLYYCDHDELIFSVDEKNADFDCYNRCFRNYKNYFEDVQYLNEIIIKLSTQISKLKSKK